MGEIFLRLVNLSISAGYLAAALILLRLPFQRAPRWLMCALWGIVALRLVCPVSVKSALSLLPSAEPLPVEAIYNMDPQIADDPDNYQLRTGMPFLDNADRTAVLRVTGTGPALRSNLDILGWIWLGGMCGMILYAGGSVWRLRRRVVTATLMRENIKQSEYVDSPFVLGFFRPVIYLPYRMDEGDLPYVIAHEQAHIRRGDHFWKPLGYLLLAVYWFHPLLWAAYLFFGRDIEAACDEKVIRKMEREERRAYSTALLNCSVQHSPIAACPLAFGEVSVKNRIRQVMDYRKPALWILIAAILAGILLAICFLTDPKREEQILPQIKGLDVAAGTTYVTEKCVYMSPLSSTLPIGGSDGCLYTVLEDALIIHFLDYEDRQVRIPVDAWEWQDFPYTEEEWREKLLVFRETETDTDTVSPDAICRKCEEIRYLSIDENIFLLRVDGELWIVRQVPSSFIWSIFRMAPSESQGLVTWEYAPDQDAAAFELVFDKGCQLCASCSEGKLADPAGSGEYSDFIPEFSGNRILWSPINSRNATTVYEQIHFYVTYPGEEVAHAGILYLSKDKMGDENPTYSAILTGEGLYLEQDGAAGRIKRVKKTK